MVSVAAVEKKDEKTFGARGKKKRVIVQVVFSMSSTKVTAAAKFKGRYKKPLYFCSRN